jgi:hypothetical protein
MQKEVVAHAADRAILLCIVGHHHRRHVAIGKYSGARGMDDSKPALIRHSDAGRYAHAALPSGRRCAF